MTRVGPAIRKLGICAAGRMHNHTQKAAGVRAVCDMPRPCQLCTVQPVHSWLHTTQHTGRPAPSLCCLLSQISLTVGTLPPRHHPSAAHLAELIILEEPHQPVDPLHVAVSTGDGLRAPGPLPVGAVLPIHTCTGARCLLARKPAVASKETVVATTPLGTHVQH